MKAIIFFMRRLKDCELGFHRYRTNSFGATWCIDCGRVARGTFWINVPKPLIYYYHNEKKYYLNKDGV